MPPHVYDIILLISAKFRVGSGQNQVESMDAVEGRAVVNGEKEDKKKCLCMYRTSVFVNIFMLFWSTDRLVVAMI